MVYNMISRFLPTGPPGNSHVYNYSQIATASKIAHLYVCILIDGMSQDTYRMVLGDPHVLFFTPTYTTSQ